MRTSPKARIATFLSLIRQSKAFRYGDSMPSHLHRYREIAMILARNGLHATAIQVGLGRWLPDSGEAQEPGNDDVLPELLVSAFEELGITFVKLGQLISARPDIFPEKYCEAFSRLTDATSPVSFEDLADVVREDFGATVDDLFESFDETPVASASIGQVHRARLHDGRHVVVKIRKPGVAEQINIDLEILRNLSWTMTRNSQMLTDMDFPGLVEEFSKSLRNELDYLTEARACEQIAENFADSDEVHLPWIDWEMTTSRVLTMEELSGLRIDDIDALDEAGIDRPDLAYRTAEAFIRMIFNDGLFHADPHAGNLFVEEDGTLALFDFGSVGRINERMRHQFARMLLAFSDEDADELTNALLEIAPPKGTLDRRLLRSDVDRLNDEVGGEKLADIHIERMASQIFRIVRRHRLSLPPDMVQLFRMVMIADGLGRKIHPEFDIKIALHPHAKRMIEDRLNPRWLAERLRKAAMTAAELGIELPGHIRTIMEQVESGGVDVNIRASELEPLMERAERIGDRFVAALIVAAMITGGTNLLAAYKDSLGRFIGPAAAAGGAVLTGGSAFIAWTSRPRRRLR